jgi:hypothetical protein
MCKCLPVLRLSPAMMRFCICISPICGREREGIWRANKSHFQQSMCILRASVAAVGFRRRADGRSDAEQGAKGRRRSCREREERGDRLGERRRTRMRRHQRRLRSRAARLGPTANPAATVPTPTHPPQQHQRPQGWPRERRRSAESRRLGAGRAPTASPFIITVGLLRCLHLSSTAERICIELKGQRRRGRADLRRRVLH